MCIHIFPHTGFKNTELVSVLHINLRKYNYARAGREQYLMCVTPPSYESRFLGFSKAII